MSGCISTAAEHQVTAPAADGDSPVLGLVLRHSSLDLAALDTAVPCARLHTRLVISEWGFAAIAGDAELVVSELVTNAIVHGSVAAADLPVRLRLSGRARGVCVEVWDCGNDMPQVRSDPLSEAPGGRGLVLVAALSSRWGAYRTDGGGKCVFAVVGT